MKSGNHELTVKRAGTVKCFEVLFDAEVTCKPRLRAAPLEFRMIMAAVATRRASPKLIKAVLESSLLNKVTYGGFHSGWSLDQLSSSTLH